jgi:hypothetical protein
MGWRSLGLKNFPGRRTISQDTSEYLKIIKVNSSGEIISYELNSPLQYLRSLVDQELEKDPFERGSEQIPGGAPVFQRPPTCYPERSLCKVF